MNKAQVGGVLVVLFVLMRLATGFHFFTEGMAKNAPGFTSEHFLRAAKGPLADLYKSYAPGPHRAYELLCQPHKWDTESPEADQEGGAPEPPYADWQEAINADWAEQRDRFTAALPADEAEQEQSEQAYESAKQGLEDYLVGIEQDIKEFQHSLWRQEELNRQIKNKGGTLPYQDDRIASMERESLATPRPWFAEVQAIEDAYHQQLRGLTGDKPPSQPVVEALDPPTKLDFVNCAVTWAVLGSGALLFVGLFTRLAAVTAAVFLCSVIASQPPWVYGSDTTVLGYQLVEITALLAIARVGAGRWWGLDGVLWGLCCGKACGKKPAEQ